jgi:hypothetical protein
MCRICEDLMKRTLTAEEAIKNLMELRVVGVIDDEHYYETIKALAKMYGEEDQKKVRGLYGEKA